MDPYNERYADMLRLRRPVSGRHARMDRIARGAQFAPFAALTGYEAVIREAGRLTREAPRLEEDEISRLDLLLRELAQNPDREAVFVCFAPDREKPGGSFLSHRGQVRRVDPIRKTVLLDSGTEFPISAIYAIEQGD